MSDNSLPSAPPADNNPILGAADLAEAAKDDAVEISAAAQSEPSPSWIEELHRGKEAMAKRVATGEPLPFRVAEFWSEASWPLHTIAVDQPTAKPSGDFLARLAAQGLTPAMNVMIHRKNAHAVGATFGPHAFEMTRTYGRVERIVADREKAKADGSYVDPEAETEAKKSKAVQALEMHAMGVGIELGDKPKVFERPNNFAYLSYLEKKAYPTPAPVLELGQWMDAGSQAEALCSKFGLRAVSVPLAFEASAATSFLGRLDSALDQLAGFLGIEPRLLGLNQCLGLRARAPGAMPKAEADQVEDGASLAEKEQAAAKKAAEDAKKKKSDSEHGMFMGNFIQIEISPNFEPVVLAHEWFHSLDLWFGSREIVAKQPWMGWQVFASAVAFTNYEQSARLKKWSSQLREGGSGAPDYLAALPQHTFLSQMRFDSESHREGEFHLPAGERLALKLMRAFDGLLPESAIAESTEQAGKLGQMISEAARAHALDNRASSQGEDTLSRRRKEFFSEWGDLASMWANRQAPGLSAEQQRDMEARMGAEVLSSLAEAWTWVALERQFPNPDVHTLQAMRMDASAGRISNYFSTPHEMLAYKLEELFLAGDKPLAEDDILGAHLLGWLREEAAPALSEACDVSFASMMGLTAAKSQLAKKPAP